jgi:DHA1 family multidrug resistance protein B-like MFS transporter
VWVCYFRGITLGLFSFLKGNILVMTVCECLWRVSIDVIYPYLSLYVLSLGGSYETIGQVMAIGSIASMILYPFGGYVADLQGRIKLIGYMTIGYAFAFLIPALTNSWQWLAVGIFIQSFVSFYFPAMQALRADSLTPGQRGIGYATMMTIPSAVGIASPMIGGLLIERFGINQAIHGLYFLGFFVGLLVAFLRLRYLKETLSSENALQIKLRDVPRMVVESYGDVVRTIRGVPRSLLTLSLLISATIFFASLVSPFWIVRAQQVVGLTTQDWGTIMLVTGAINVLISIPAGSLVDRFSRRWVLGISLILGSIPTYLYLYVSDYNQLLLLSVSMTVINSFMNPAFQAIFADMTPRKQRGRIMAAIGTGGIWLMGGAWGSGVMGMLLQSTGTFLSGYIYKIDISMPWKILSASLIILGLLFILLVRDPENAED